MSEFPIIGHERQLNWIKASFETGRFPHALLFQGKEGIGKKRVAYYTAALLLCENKRACLNCRECRKVIKNLHPDVKLVEPEKSISISQIRELQEWAILAPMEGSNKICIIDDAHKMTREASNAFLKTLEEPPEGTVFILVTSNMYKLPETIISRCQVVRFQPLSPEETEKVCEALKVNGLRKKICMETGTLVFASVKPETIEKLKEIVEKFLREPKVELLTESGELTKDARIFELFLFLLRKNLNARLKSEERLIEFHNVLKFVEEIFNMYNISLRSLYEYLVLKGAAE